jgi:hypothetical protein
MMLKRFYKELLLAAGFTAGLFWFSDFVGKMTISLEGGLNITPELFVFSLAMLVLPSLLGTIPSGYLIGKQEKGVLPSLFVPALGAVLGVAAVVALNSLPLLFAPDAVLQEEMAKMATRGIGMFAEMSVQEYRSLLAVSLALGTGIIALINFAIGMAGGFLGRILGKRFPKGLLA